MIISESTGALSLFYKLCQILIPNITNVHVHHLQEPVLHNSPCNKYYSPISQLKYTPLKWTTESALCSSFSMFPELRSRAHSYSEATLQHRQFFRVINNRLASYRENNQWEQPTLGRQRFNTMCSPFDIVEYSFSRPVPLCKAHLAVSQPRQIHKQTRAHRTTPVHI